MLSKIGHDSYKTLHYDYGNDHVHDSDAHDEVANDVGPAHDDDDGHDKDRDEDDDARYILARLGAIWRSLGLS